MDLADLAAGIGSLAEPVRRHLYEYVVAQAGAVGREQAAEAVGVPVHTAKLHLDRLVDGAADATVMPAFGVGAGNRTAEAMTYYQSGDRHRVVLGNAPGQITVCVAEAEPTSPAICQTIEIPRTTPEVRDGRGRYPAIPLIFQR